MVAETFAYESIGLLLTNIGLFGGGIGFGIAGLIMGATRGMTKDADMWAITFSSFAWLIALLVPNMPWALSIWFCGAIGIILSFMPILEKLNDSNIFAIAIITIAVNFIIVMGSQFQMASWEWQNNFDSVESDIESIMGTEYNSTTNMMGQDMETGLCRPDDPSCSKGALSNSYSPLSFDPITTLLTIPLYIGKAIALAGMTLFAPLLLTSLIGMAGMINPVIMFLTQVILVLWNLVLVYKIIAFILNRRGMKT